MLIFTIERNGSASKLSKCQLPLTDRMNCWLFQINTFLNDYFGDI